MLCYCDIVDCYLGHCILKCWWCFSVCTPLLCYFSHVLHQEKMNMKQTIRTGLTSGKKNRGRPAIPWIDTIDEWTQGLTFDQHSQRQEILDVNNYSSLWPTFMCDEDLDTDTHLRLTLRSLLPNIYHVNA